MLRVLFFCRIVPRLLRQLQRVFHVHGSSHYDCGYPLVYCRGTDWAKANKTDSRTSDIQRGTLTMVRKESFVCVMCVDLQYVVFRSNTVANGPLKSTYISASIT